MAIDFLILTLLLLSFVINLLALGAFWVTPGLRTTANRFTINLLVINLIGCLILAPTLFLSQSASSNVSLAPAPTEDVANASTPTASAESAAVEALSSSLSLAASASDDRIEILAKPGNRQMTIKHNGKLVEQEGVIVRRNLTGAQDPRTIETIYKCNSTYCQELTIDEGTDTIVITEIEEANHHSGAETVSEAHSSVVSALLPRPHIRCWSIDMAAALGALGVLLVVGDTWCAVTDPLRYHTRISSLKTWVFIALTWLVGLMFGALSAFREIDFTSTTVLHERQGFAELSMSSANSIFGITFACVYFVIIILLPFGFVCGMYWRIFSEARENGLRMRQNGSSPLLQSALNLTHNQQSSSLQYANMCAHRNSVSSASSNGGSSACERGGLQMQIDQRRSSPVCARRDSAAKVLLPTISDDGLSDEAAQLESGDFNTEPLVPLTQQPNYADRNQNILLTLQTASGEIKRNYSARQLPLLGTSSQDLQESHGLQGVRQVHSSPNLHKYTQDALEPNCSPHLLGHQQLHAQQHTPTVRHQQFMPQNSHNRTQHSHVLQIPCLQHGSPKALSYMSTLRHRLSNASSLFKYREESRTVRISILVIIMFLVSYLPYGFLVLLQSRMASANFEHSTQLAIFMLLLGNLTSPFIFAYRNKRVRRGVKRLFGFEASTRERSLQRQSSSSGRGSGFLNRHCAGTRSGANIRRNISKLSTHSLNSCKFLTPQNSLSGAVPPPTPAAVGASNRHSSPARIHGLRPNSSCSTIINFSAPLAKETTPPSHQHQHQHQQQQQHHHHHHHKSNTAVEANKQKTVSVEPTSITTTTTTTTTTKHCDTIHPAMKTTFILNMNGNSPNGTARITQTTATLPALNGKFEAKRSLFKIFFQSSKNLSCAAAQSCAQGKETEVEPAEV
ncbi:uncharacterized protein LOC101458248 [Ceratitis capitata]|uniref:uncharacterized protein LOC101458248 n=1 Tax=Ceratitis capitata TaxID=7213 RepID=UPI000618886C|nr:uncharacterized protein LOC101458248 [Ceratitis capitata]